MRVIELDSIQQTLDSNDCFEGLRFVPEMAQFCGKEFVVLKQVRRILDYYNHGIRILKRTYILDGVHCKGSTAYPDCDRTCFHFWKEAWLRKV